MSYVLGLSGVLHRNTGTYGSPVWVAIGAIGDLDMPIEAEEADATTRNSGGFEQVLASIKKASIEFDMKYDTTDTNWSALLTAFMAGTPIEFLALDGPVATTGSQGLRVTCVVTKHGRSEKLKDVMATSVTLRPTMAAHAPAWFTAP